LVSLCIACSLVACYGNASNNILTCYIIDLYIRTDKGYDTAEHAPKSLEKVKSGLNILC